MGSIQTDYRYSAEEVGHDFVEERHLGDHLYSEAKAGPNFEGVGHGSVAEGCPEMVAFVPELSRDVVTEASPGSDRVLLLISEPYLL